MSIFEIFGPLCTLKINATTGVRKILISTGDRVRISEDDLPFRKGCKSLFTLEFFDNIAITVRKPPTYPVKDELNEITDCNFFEQCQLTMEPPIIGLVSDETTQHFPDNTLISYNLFNGATESRVPIGGCNSEMAYLKFYQIVNEVNFMFIDIKFFRVVRISIFATQLQPL